ncbi:MULTISPECIES: Na+/H+ antiporter NhaA [unclassified Cryobacterium]|uniref:Na+/H+ antiporter NhaA n=1 Tax=unclassified Cryobacterium TaxID=2649013 RepID=UPI00106BA9B1|nr:MULTISPECIES: Na+/H+ antiporter NhaA [unclassified Cryobacterium]TFB96874.1 hypothetical protein E3O39_09105 [Cryobacterium sp. MDB2-A-1]TFC07218.1 hypothetical protein E3O59_09710 [Cryobacterium sp. MDB2-33-2]TFC12199.1 hypothetical protein E3O35_09370 [Cryobacterium sp. MDB2-A-2]TFC16271.1 hypothetical protein E3O51_12615 [Cryobacterium sp. MDB2-10]TFC34546.1 hypothetical protein E3O55_02750 [Cryobacterium sp. MDB1-18-2]
MDRTNGWLARFVSQRSQTPQLTALGHATVGALGGIGFTVSLLLNKLALGGSGAVADEGTLAVLLGSVISMVVAAVLISRLAAVHRREGVRSRSDLEPD